MIDVLDGLLGISGLGIVLFVFIFGGECALERREDFVGGVLGGVYMVGARTGKWVSVSASVSPS